ASCPNDAAAVTSRITVSAASPPAPVPPAPSATAITTPPSSSITFTRSSQRRWYATVRDVVSKGCMLRLDSRGNSTPPRWVRQHSTRRQLTASAQRTRRGDRRQANDLGTPAQDSRVLIGTPF